uniref:Uncharacterized protein n=1 Tax=Acrobeloides nanus TaxID=290746 RepID=A0A914EDT5_9BILA
MTDLWSKSILFAPDRIFIPMLGDHTGKSESCNKEDNVLLSSRKSQPLFRGSYNSSSYNGLKASGGPGSLKLSESKLERNGNDAFYNFWTSVVEQYPVN